MLKHALLLSDMVQIT